MLLWQTLACHSWPFLHNHPTFLLEYNLTSLGVRDLFLTGCHSLAIVGFIFWRLKVLYTGGKISFLRAITGLTIHHYHYGLLILTFFLLLYLFYSKKILFVGFIGLGLGSVLDSFMSRLFSANTRAQEIFNYNINFWNTILLFGIVLIFACIFYLKRK